jgi:hypothetical protein
MYVRRRSKEFWKMGSALCFHIPKPQTSFGLPRTTCRKAILAGASAMIARVRTSSSLRRVG